MVVDRNNGVHIFLAQCAHQVVGTLLHLGIGTLDGIQLNAVTVSAGINRRHTAATQADAVVVATDHDDLVAFLGFLLQTVALRAVAHATGQHDDLVVGILRRAYSNTVAVYGTLLMLKREHGAADEWLTELVAEVAGTIGSLDENLLGRLVEPLANRQDVLPVAGGH